MKKNVAKYTCYVTLTASILVTTVLASVACSGPEMPKTTVSYGPEIGFADGNVNLSGTAPIINISDIKAEVGMNIDYLSGVVVENEEEFDDLEIRVDASMVDIFTPGNYKVVYTFLFNDNLVSKEITVSLFESEQSASESNEITTQKTSGTVTTQPASGNTVADKETSTTHAGDAQKPTATTNNNIGTTKPTATTNDNTGTTKPTATTSNNSGTTKPTATTNNNTGTTKPITTTKPTVTTNGNSGSDTSADTSTTREIITTTGNQTTSSKNIGNYTIELLSGKTITIKNTTSRYIVSTRTDVETVEEDGYTYRISKLIITYNTGFGQILETIKDRIK